MKKAKVTRNPRSQAEFVLRPSRWRMLLIYVILFALAVTFGLLIRSIFSGGFSTETIFGDWQINAIIVVGGAVAFALLDYRRWTMRVQGGEYLEGPTGAFGERIILPLKEINWERSGKSLRSRFGVGTAIYTHGGRRILISPWFYEPGHFKAFLYEIGYR